MIGLSFKVTSNVDLDRVRREVPCPCCGFYNGFFLKQVRLRETIICRGCKSNVQLDDHMNQYRKAVRSIEMAIRRLQEAFD